MLIYLLLFLFAYLLGSISSAIFVCKIFHLQDPRIAGSKNPGTTNVMRIGGKIPASITLIADVLKGVIPVLIAKMLFKENTIPALTILCSFLGHVFPVYYRFKGGKGVATAIGGLFALSIFLGGIFVAAWLLIFFSTKISSLSALFATTITPIFSFFILGSKPSIPIIMMCVLIFYTHRENIKRLIEKKESKLH